MKKIIKSAQFFLLVFIVILSSSKSINQDSILAHEDINKLINLSTMSKKIEEFDYDTYYGAKATYTGDLTGYAYNCPACTGQLYCNWRYDLSDGTTTYNDETYGEVYIVASSSNLPCGSIIRFQSKRISDEDIYAIVLDRGVRGTAIDLLTPSEEYASKFVGRSKITYDVIRVGYTNEG